MLGISGLFSSSNLVKQAKAPIVSDAIMVGDYVGTLGDDEASTYAMRAGNAKIVRVNVLPNFISYLKRGEEVFRHGIIGHCDGKFPVTNPVTNNIYFNPKDNKYYKCKTSFTGTVATPDEVKFEELSLEKIVKNGLVSSVNITGAAKGNGVSNGSGVITVNTTVNYNDITGKPVSLPNPQVLTISLNGTTTEYKGDAAKTVTITAAAIGAQPAGNYSVVGHNHTADDISGLPTTLPNPNNLVIKLNGVSTLTYSGKSAGEINITPSSIGAQPAGSYALNNHNHDNAYSKLSHNHDEVYSKLDHIHDDYALTGHNHRATQIDSMVGYKKPSSTGAITVNDTLLSAIGKLETALDSKQPVGSYAVVGHNHDDKYFTETEITEKLAGYQVKGSYASSDHNHSGVYAPVSHTHVSSGITAMTGYTKAVSVSAIAVTDSLNVAIGKLEKALDGKAPTGNYSVVGHNHNETYNTKAEITSLLAGKLGATANAVSASKLATAKTISVSGAVSGSNTFDGSANMNISVTLNGFDASKITSGTINVDRLPKTALSEFIPVANRAARLALTKTEAQNGDTVKETDTKKMFLVIDDTKLSSDAGYEEYTTVVDWSTITGRPSQFQPVSHTHTWAQISDRPSTLPNPNGLVISLNGKAQTAYTGVSAVAFDITPASIGAQVAGSYASSSHNHDSVYAKVSHSHTITQIGALAGYTKAEQVAAISASDTILSAFGKLEKALDGKQAAGSYASASHTHSGVYQPVGNYSLVGHNHDETYSKLSHAHTWDSITGKPGSFAPSAHNQASSTITAMTGYAKASSVSAIGVTDSLNVAIGKLEKALDGKQAAGSYASSSHNHDGVYQPVGSYAAATHNHDTVYAAKSHNHSGVYQPAGSYALSSHNHDGVYAAVSHSHSYLPLSGGTLTGDLITKLNGGIKYLDASGVGKWLISNNNGTSIALGYSSSGNNVPVYCYNEIYANGSSKVWHAGNLNPANYASSGHNHDDRYATASHGNHVPATQSANNKVFLRCDNTWATITPANIGAQPAGSYAAASHNHSYLPLSGGTVSGALTVTGQILSNADVVAYSDARVKTNVVKIDSALDKVSAINGYTYDMQGVDFKGKRQAGVIAQELKEVLPEAVVTDDNGYYAVRYTNIIPLLIEALKEERSKRESLEERLAKIERMLDIK